MEDSSLSSQWAEQALNDIDRIGHRRQLETWESPQGPVVELRGRKFINFSSNDYLGLAANQAVMAAATRAVDQHGVGTGASRLIAGDTLAHRSLERALAQAFRSPAALLFNSGYHANIGVLSTVVGEGDVIFSDAYNHASIIDGCRLSRAQIEVFPHGDAVWLERRLREVTARRRLIVTDAVFSMDGDVAPIHALAELASKYRAALMVDEAHAVGVVGAQGEGLCASVGVRADFRMGTLGKSLGSAGAFVLCDAQVREWLINQSRPLIFSTSLPAATCAAAEAALSKLMTEPRLMEQLRSNIRQLSAGFRSLGLSASGDSAIFGVILGTPERALKADEALREHGVLAKAIRPPTVPKGTSRLRMAVSAAHTREHLETALEALSSLQKRGLL